MRDSLAEREICVIDISTRGLLATAARPPKRGEFIELTIGCNKLAGQVAWSSQHRFGVSLRERVSVAAVAEGGRDKVELARSVGVRRQRTGMLAALHADPQALGRIGQFATFALLAAAAAWLILGFFGEAMAPVQAAVAGMN
jgi:hypothetical protein